MSASTPPIGIDHPTVVPANFDPKSRDDDEAGGSAEASDDDRTDG